MKHLFSILIAAILCANASAQTIKTLGYNTTNGQVVANTGTNVLTFKGSNGIVIEDGVGGQTITVNSSGINFETGPNGSVLNIPSDDPVQLGGGVWDDPNIRAALGIATPIWVRQTNNVTNDSGVTFSNTSLTFTVPTGKKYLVELGVLASDNYGGAIDGKISISNAPTVLGYWNGTQTHVTNTDEIVQFQQNGGSQLFVQKFIVEANATNNGTVRLQFKTQTQAYEVIINAGSYLRAEEIK